MADIGSILDDIREILETNIPLINISIFQIINDDYRKIQIV